MFDRRWPALRRSRGTGDHLGRDWLAGDQSRRSRCQSQPGPPGDRHLGPSSGDGTGRGEESGQRGVGTWRSARSRLHAASGGAGGLPATGSGRGRTGHPSRPAVASPHARRRHTARVCTGQMPSAYRSVASRHASSMPWPPCPSPSSMISSLPGQDWWSRHATTAGPLTSVNRSPDLRDVGVVALQGSIRGRGRVQAPRVKSGKSTGAPPCATETSDRGPGADQAAAS